MKILITDFDGTISKVDFYQTVIDLGFADKAYMQAYWEAYWSHKITHFEAMKGIMGNIQVGPDKIGPALDAMQFDPNFKDAFDKLTQAGWSVAIVSAGCEWYIREHLKRAGVPCTSDHTQLCPGTIYIASNPGTFTETQGLQLELPESSPFFDLNTGVDKPGIARYFIDLAEESAFAGDGRPDYAPAMLFSDNRRFATGWLADELESENKHFTRFSQWYEVVAHLLK